MILILLIVVLVLLIVCPLVLKNKKGPRNATLAVLLLAAAGLVIANTKSLTGSKADPGSTTYRIHEVALAHLGKILAGDQIEGGKVVVFLRPEESDGMRKSNAAHMAGLRRGSDGAAFDFVVVQPSAGGVPAASPMDTAPRHEDIRNALAEHAGAAAIVSCVDLPIEALAGETLPPLYLFDGMRTLYWQDAFAAGKVKAVIAPREEMAAVSPAQLKGDPNAVFDASFEIKRGTGD